MFDYTKNLLAEHDKSWMEVTLYFAIKLIREDLGISNIFYHDWETGAVIKNIRGTRPPRNLYAKLPKMFCFEKTQDGPAFVVNHRGARRRLKKAKTVRWYRLELN